MDAKLRQLAARAEITDQVHRYCRAIDRCDPDLLKTVFHADAIIDHGAFKAPAAVFCENTIPFIQKLEITTHHLSNVLVDFESENKAVVESCWTAFHRIAAGVELPAIFADHDPAREEDLLVGGRYIDRFEDRGEGWKIAGRIGLHDWHAWAPSDKRNFPSIIPAETVGLRDESDRSYGPAHGDGRKRFYAR